MSPRTLATHKDTNMTDAFTLRLLGSGHVFSTLDRAESQPNLNGRYLRRGCEHCGYLVPRRCGVLAVL